MTLREQNLRVFQRESLPSVFFQPRFEPWVDWHNKYGGLPEELEGKTLREAYDMIGASMRTVNYYTGQPSPIDVSYDDTVKVSQREDEETVETIYETPAGILSEKSKLTVDGTWRVIEFPAKSAKDLSALLHLVTHRRFSYNKEAYQSGKAFISDRGEGHFWVPKSPWFALAQQLMRYEDFVFAVIDCPDQIAEIMESIDRSYDGMYEQLCSAEEVNILNFGENIADAYLSPGYYETYMQPWYEKRSGQLRDAGIFTHIHIDGNFRNLLPYLKDIPFDGLEALTPTPQGDVELDEMAEAMGDKILLDGIPAVYFLTHHSREEMQACVERLVELFHPRLVLGVSDELPEGSTAEGWERLKWVADYAKQYTGSAGSDR